MTTLSQLQTAAFDTEAIKTLASAFDTSWNVLQRSGSTLAADDMAIIAREALTKRIIAMGWTGERDRHRLVNCSLVQPANFKFISHEGCG